MRRVAQLIGTLAISVLFMRSTASHADTSQVERGRYLVQLGGCTDCHTPGHLLGKPDTARFLGGSDVGLEVAGLGTFIAPNLTPDEETGLGTWTREQIIAAIQTGVRPDGRVLAPIMPWRAYAEMTKPDVGAVVDYLKSLPRVSHKVLGPFGPGEEPVIFRMKIVPPQNGTKDEHTP
jgi:mono/diheme cytochrome c family protein